MLNLLTIGGGVALILFGVRHLRKGLDRMFGDRLGHWLGELSGSRLKSMLGGVAVSVIAPSSTTMSVLAVQMLKAGQMTTRQMLALMLGVDIGLTVMVLLISLQVQDFVFVLMLAGVPLFLFTSGSRSRGLGQILLALGLIFLAIGAIKQATGKAVENEDLMQILTIANGYPEAIALLAAVICVSLQSSTATIGLAIALAPSGALSLGAALAMVAGANVGTAATLLAFGWRQADSRRLALALLAAKTAVAVAALLALPWAADFFASLPGTIEQQVAYSHTGFNLLVAIVFFPLVGLLDRLMHALVPPTPESQFGPRYIDTGVGGSVPLALNQSLREIMHVAEIVRSMLGDLWRALTSGDKLLANQVALRDDQVDLLEEEIKRFLTTVVSLEQDPDHADEQMRQLRYLNELESMGDIVSKNLSPLAVKKIKLEVCFSDEGWSELDMFYGKVLENMLVAETTFASGDAELAKKLLDRKQEIDRLEGELRDRHFSRLNAGLQESFETSAIHLDILTHLKRINDCVAHAGHAIRRKDAQAMR